VPARRDRESSDEPWWRSPWATLRLGAQITWQAVVHLIDDGGTILAGHIAFATLFALFPFLIFLTTVAGLIGQGEAAGEAIAFGLEAIPPEVAAAIKPSIDEVLASPRTGLMTISILTTVWVVSSGLEALRDGLNTAYGIEEPRPWWWRRLQSLAFTVLLSVSIIILMVMLVFAPLVYTFAKDMIDEVIHVPTFWSWLYGALRYLVAVGLFYLVIALLYRWLPNRHLSRREVLPGAAVTVVLWIGLASLFSLYLQNLGRFTITYGSLGGIVVTMLFFYLTALIFIFGAEINSARRRALASQLKAERERARQLAASG
jgi:membrane protein